MLGDGRGMCSCHMASEQSFVKAADRQIVPELRRPRELLPLAHLVGSSSERSEISVEFL